MVKLNLQLFGGRGGGSGGGGGGIGAGHNTGRSGSKGHGSAGSSGTGFAIGNRVPTEREEEERTRSRQSSTSSVTKLKSGETYTVYKVSDSGKQTELSSDMTSSQLKSGVLKGTAPDSNDGLWKDKQGRKYRVVRSR